MPKVLLIEDNADHREMARRVLVAKGYDVLTAADAETGLDLATVQHPDIILLDLGLPDVDGQTLVGWIRRVPELADVPIIAVTAWPADVAYQMVVAYGFDGYITKPIQFSSFADKIASFLASAAAGASKA